MVKIIDFELFDRYVLSFYAKYHLDLEIHSCVISKKCRQSRNLPTVGQTLGDQLTSHQTQRHEAIQHK